MSIDNIFVHLSADELKRRILNGKVNNIRQIDRDAFLFSVHTYEENLCLLLNVNPLTARVCITENAYTFSEKPSNFLLLLRKYLTGKKISSVEHINNDRIIRFSFSGSNQFGDEKVTFLYAELIGNNTNLILSENAGIIIDCLKKKEYSDSAQRAVLPGLLYRLPAAPSGCVLPHADDSEIKALASEAGSFENFISQIYGISARIKRSISGYSELYSFLSYIRSDRIQYFCYESGGEMMALSYIPLKEYTNNSCHVFDSLSQAFDYYYRLLDFEQKNGRIAKKLNGSVSVLLNRKKKKLVNLEKDLTDCSQKEAILQDAELLKANLYKARKGDRYVKCTDFFSDEISERILEIDPSIEPSAFLSSLYKKYSKFKTAESVLDSEIKKCRYEIEYLESVLDEINRASDENETAEIERELFSAGYIKAAGRKKQNSPTGIMIVSAPSGKEILIGKNNAQNDELTFKKAYKDDLWFHVKNLHGSHVILRSSGTGFSETDISAAAEYAAYYSQARNSGKTAVDYTMAGHVRRNSPYYPGRVLYTDFKTIIVSSEGPQKNNKSG